MRDFVRPFLQTNPAQASQCLRRWWVRRIMGGLEPSVPAVHAQVSARQSNELRVLLWNLKEEGALHAAAAEAV